MRVSRAAGDRRQLWRTARKPQLERSCETWRRAPIKTTQQLDTLACAVVANLVLLVVTFVVAEFAAVLVEKRILAPVGGALMLTVAALYAGGELRTRLRTGSFRSAVTDRNFWDAMVLLLFILPGPLLGGTVALIT